MLDKKSIENDRISNIPGYEAEPIQGADSKIPKAMAQIATELSDVIAMENTAWADNMLIDANNDVIACFKKNIKHNTEKSVYSPEMVDHINSILQKRIEEKEQENIQLKTTLLTSADIKGED